MRIQHNIMAMNAYRNYTNNVSAMKKNLEKLSSGYKINRAGDDAAGLAISEKMRAQITGLETAQKNAKDGISLVQTAEGALTEVHDMLNRMVELATQSANGTYDNTTDRFQMQKEVNQLLEEIDRIADSSNFNGINLLDGKLGLNTEAFTLGSAAAVSATSGAVDISGALAAETDAYSNWHKEAAGVAAANPQFSIDLGTLAVDGCTAADTLDIVIGSNTFAVTLGDTSAAANDIATALVTAMKNTDNATGLGVTAAGGVAAAGDTVVGIKIGDAAYTIGAANAGKIDFTYMGRYDGATFKAETTFTGDATKAAAINNSIGMAVEAGTASGGTVTGHTVHDTTGVQEAKASVTAGLAGIDLNLDSNIVKNGNVLEIDGIKFQFKTSNTGFTMAAGLTAGDVIDLTTATSDAERIHMAADKLSDLGKTALTGTEAGRTWKIGVENGTTIHIEQVSTADAAATDPTKVLDSYDKLTSLIKVTGKATDAKNVGTTIAVTPGKITEGNTITIGEGDNAKKYEFTTDAKKLAKGTDGNITYVDMAGDRAKNLYDKIAATDSTAEYDAASKTITVRAANNADGTKPTQGPIVLGKGLTLQIGDTADSFNQLNVAVRDMHAISLGIDGLKIDTEEAAQAATDKIKAAINTVSDVRGTLGATQNRLDHTINNLSVMTENIQDAESTIRDVDVAEEMMAYTKNNILIQSAQAMLAQANQVPQGVLQLLQ